jgi:hypothetical protein
MRKVIDLECDLPPDEHGNPRKMEEATHPPGYGDPERLPPLPGHGFSNYARIFTRRTDAESAPATTKHDMSHGSRRRRGRCVACRQCHHR